MSLKNEKKFIIWSLAFSLIFILSFFLTTDIFQKNKNISAEIEPPVVLETPKVKNQNLDLLGRSEISYTGGTEGRHKNIEIGVSRFNDKVVKPGEEFSFTKVLGTTTPADGFSIERIFLNGEVTKGIGGGLCQVSTALFRSVISAGLPVTERHNHTYTVSYYDVGLDATYSDPGPDLKFLNDTGKDIVIKSKTENEKVVFEIYGVKDGRVASTSEPEVSDTVDFPPMRYIYDPTRDPAEPECINNPQIGYTTKVRYGVLYPNGQYKEQVFDSTYKPLQRVCYILDAKMLKYLYIK